MNTSLKKSDFVPLLLRWYDKNIYLFSATISKKVQEITKEYMKNSIRISAAVENSAADNVKHIYYIVDSASRYKAIKRILDKNPTGR